MSHMVLNCVTQKLPSKTKQSIFSTNDPHCSPGSLVGVKASSSQKLHGLVPLKRLHGSTRQATPQKQSTPPSPSHHYTQPNCPSDTAQPLTVWYSLNTDCLLQSNYCLSVTALSVCYNLNTDCLLQFNCLLQSKH